MPPFCQDLKASYEHLENLTADLTHKYRLVRDSGDLGEVRRLRQELEKARGTLVEQLIRFVIPDALNPYHEALTTAGSTKTKERGEVVLDIRQEIQRQLALYESVTDKDGNYVLAEWVQDIVSHQGLIYEAVVKDYEKVIARIKEGMIPIVMPSRAVQERTWLTAMTNLKPIWIENKVEKEVNEAHIFVSGYYRVRDRFKELEGANKEPAAIHPLDYDEASTCFLSAGEFDGGYVPDATCYRNRPQLRFSGYSSVSLANAKRGFRPAGRF